MKKFIFLSIILFGVLFFAENSLASVNLPWSTTFDCADWTYPASLNCDGMGIGGAWGDSCGDGEQINSSANYSGGGGYKGQIHYLGPGLNDNTGGLAVSFSSPPTEIWMRFYIAYSTGITLNSGNKVLYFYDTAGAGTGYFCVNESRDGWSWTTQTGDSQKRYTETGGWSEMYPTGTADGSWHCIEIHIKKDTNGSNGLLDVWVNGKLRGSWNNVGYGMTGGFDYIKIGSNHGGTGGAGCKKVYYDDIAISTTGYIGPISQTPDTTPPSVPAGLTATAVSSSQINLSWTASTDNVGVAGYRIYRCQGSGCTPSTQTSTSPTNSYSDTGLSPSTTYVYRVAGYDAAGNVSGQSSSASATTQAGTVTILFQEPFEDTNFSSRGWYDITGGALSTTEHISGSTRSLECRFNQGETSCAGGSPARHLFNETDNVYLDYWVKYSSNYIGTGTSAGPHEFHFLTNKDGTYIGPAGTHLTTYIEQNSGTPRLGIQDMLNVDTNCIRRNDGSFVGCNGNFSTYPFTENRSVASCNGIMGGFDKSDCFQWDSTQWYSARLWDASQAYFRNEPNQWHHVKVQFKMNSISGGKGVTDGKLKYWLDDRMIISYDNILLRTAVNADMKFNQFFIAPYMGNGSPVTQTMWIDDLRVYAEASTPDTTPPAAPTGLTVN